MSITSSCTYSTIEREKNNSTKSTEIELNEDISPDSAISRNEIVPNPIPE